MIVSTALLCLAINTYHEARGELIPGQYAVNHVVLNRAGGDPDKACEVIFKRHQFSWTSKVSREGKGWRLPTHMVPKDKDAWARAQIIARVTLEGRMHDLTRGADHYHATYVAPSWRHAMAQTKRIGTHIFYKAK